MQPKNAQTTELEQLVEVVSKFRGEGGCAWYESQTHESLVPYLIEESAEVVDAIEDGTDEDLREELGDVLFQVLFHADLAASRGAFDLEDVAREQAEKLRRRNPHVFGDKPTRDMDEIIRLWHETKAEEKKHRTSVLDGVSHAMPGLALADKVIGRAAQVGIKVTGSEAARAQEDSVEASTIAADLTETAEAAFGERLLAAVAAGKAAGLDAERALRGAIRRLEAKIREAEAGEQA